MGIALSSPTGVAGGFQEAEVWGNCLCGSTTGALLQDSTYITDVHRDTLWQNQIKL
jgi:hypothetical protein